MTIAAGIVFLIVGWGLMRLMINVKGARTKTPFDASKLIWSSLYYGRRQAMLSFITLASGIFILFSVGLNRRGFSDSSQTRAGTGGFSLWCETSVPVYHNIQTPEGRAKLALKELPNDVYAVQLLKYSADDASCLNLNKVITPNVLGIDMEELEASDFNISKTTFADSGKAYPALVDKTVLTWSLGKKLGDTLWYVGDRGETVPILLAGTIQNSIFQGYILIDKSSFSQIWSEITGSEIFLIKTPKETLSNTKALISQALNNYGVRIMTTAERLQLFYSVIDTYLTIFFTLGGLGLLLGIFSFVIVVRKNLLAAKEENALFFSLGFDKNRLADLRCKENTIIPLYAIVTGAWGALVGVSMGLGNVGTNTWGLAVVLILVFIFCVTGFVKSVVNNHIIGKKIWKH